MVPDVYPVARTAGLAIREVDGETLIHDSESGTTSCLDRTTAAVWTHCDGTKSVSEIRAIVLPDSHPDIVWIAVEQLRSMNLLVDVSLPATKFSGMTRRQIGQPGDAHVTLGRPQVVQPDPARLGLRVAELAQGRRP